MKNNPEYTFIYGLYTEDDLIQYVGKADNPLSRLKRHISDSKREKTKKSNWINKCLSLGKEIKIKILETVLYENWSNREKFWIEKYGIKNLRNTSDGGLGASGVKKYNISYEDAKSWMKENLNGIKMKDYAKLAVDNKLPSFMPKKPHDSFKKEWISWGEFSGRQKYHRKNFFLSFNECRNFVHALNIKSQNKWNEYCKSDNKPFNVPSNPPHQYKNSGWTNWGDFLGTNKISDQEKKNNYVNFSYAVEFVRRLKLNSKTEWRIWHKKNNPSNIPLNPQISYGEWRGWNYFLGKFSKARNFMTYEEAKNYIKKFSFKSYNELLRWTKTKDCPHNFPHVPSSTYKKNGWINSKEFMS